MSFRLFDEIGIARLENVMKNLSKDKDLKKNVDTIESAIITADEIMVDDMDLILEALIHLKEEMLDDEDWDKREELRRLIKMFEKKCY